MVSGTYYWILSDVIVVVVVAFVALVIARCCLHEQMNRRQCTIHTIQFVLYESAMRLDSTGPREVQRYVCGRGESGVRRAKILREEGKGPSSFGTPDTEASATRSQARPRVKTSF